MKLVHGRSATWYFVKSLVILAVIGVTLLHVSFKQSLKSSSSVASSISTTSLHSLMMSSGSSVSSSFVSRNNATRNLYVMMENAEMPLGDGDDGDDDGNTKICHKVARYRNNKCEYVKTNCNSPLAGGLINYLRIRYCTFSAVPFFFFVFAFVWVLLLFYMLSDTAETYFCPSLTQISRYLKLSPNVAGVTFLALGNGAPDIASIIAGVFSGSSGFGVGEPVGAGLFVTTCVMSAVCIFSEVKVDGIPFLRDVGTYLCSVTFVFIVCVVQGRIYLWHALVCLVIYFTYVSVVVIGRAIHVYRRSLKLNKERKKLEEQKRILTTGSSINEDDSEASSLLASSSALTRKMGKNSAKYYQTVEDEDEIEIGAKWTKQPVLVHVVAEKKKRKKRIPRKKKDEQEQTDETQIQIQEVESDGEEETTQVHLPNRPEWGDLTVVPVTDKNFVNELKRHASSGYFVPKIGLVFERDSSTPDYNEMKRTSSFIIEDHFAIDPHTITEADNVEVEDSYLQQFLHWIEWDQKSLFDKLFYLVVSPAVLARNLTIPQSDPEAWSKFFAVLSPIFIGPFALFATGYLNTKLGHVFPLWALILMISLTISAMIFVTSSRSRPPSRYHFIFVFAGFACSVIWIYLVANELVSILQSCGIMWQISDGILALTVLAWGNSLGDMVSNVVVARQGFPEMAIAACYGGPCMNLLIGLGVSMLAHCIKYNYFEVNLETNVFVSFVFLLGSIISAVLVVSLNKFRAPKIYGAFLLIMYIAFMLVSVLIESGLIFKPV